MSATYILHPAFHVVLTRYLGTVSDDEFIGLYRALYADPGYVLGMNELADLRAAVGFSISGSALRTVEALGEAAYRGSGKSFRTAIIAPSDLSYGVARMYEVLAETGPEQVSVFRTAGEALEWLGLDGASGVLPDEAAEA